MSSFSSAACSTAPAMLACRARSGTMVCRPATGSSGPVFPPTATGVNGERKRARGGFPLNLNIDNQGTGSMSPLLLLFGNLNNGSGNAGMSYSNRNNGLSNRNWNIGSRLFQLTVKAYSQRLPVSRHDCRNGQRAARLVGKRTSGVSRKRFGCEEKLQTRLHQGR